MTIEQVRSVDVDGGEGVIATIIRRTENKNKEGATFYTGPDNQLQVGRVCYQGGGGSPAHRHIHHDRTVKHTEEVVIVTTGEVVVELFNSAGGKEKEVTLSAGDIIIFHSGGHGLTAVMPSELIEVKQGPYMGRHDKIKL